MKPEIVRQHPRDLHQRRFCVSVQDIGPRHTEFDRLGLIVKAGRCFLFAEWHWNWQLFRLRVEYWPKSPKVYPYHSVVRRFVDFAVHLD